MKHNLQRLLSLCAAAGLVGAAHSAELKPLVEFPPATNVNTTVTVSNIVGGCHIERVDVLLDRAVMFGPVDLNAEISRMLLLLATLQATSKEPINLLALEDHGPTIRVTMNAGRSVVVRRIHNDCYRLYWDGKTAWFYFGGSFNPQGGANGSQPYSSDTNQTSAAAVSRRSH